MSDNDTAGRARRRWLHHCIPADDLARERRQRAAYEEETR